MHQPFSLKGKRALITGGGTGLGYGIAKTFIEAEAEVIIAGRREQVLKEAAENLGEKCYYQQFDVTDLAKIPAFVQDIESNIGSIDILVNNAGKHLKKDAVDTTDAEFLEVLQVHLLSVFALIRECSKRMIERKGGSIILISSMSAIMGLGQVVAYSTGKTGILGMMRNLVIEFAPHHVRINAIAPGWIESPMLHQALDKDSLRRNRILNRIPSGKFGEPEDIGHAALYLASDASAYVNGVLLPVDGGAAIGF